MNITEKSLINRYISGDAKAFEELVLTYQNRVYNRAYTILMDQNDALDVTQEVFIKIYNNIHNFKGKSSIITWIIAITNNASYDYIRRKREYNMYCIDEYCMDTFLLSRGMNKDFSIEDLICTKEMQKTIREGINRLPINHRNIIILRDFQQMSYEEIAKALNCSLGLVKSRLYRARRALRKIFTSLGIYEHYYHHAS